MNSKTLPSDHHHRSPLTRRDFLTMGAISSSAMLLAPRLLGASSAFAASGCEAVGLSASNYIPFLVFDMAGGAALPGSFLVGGKGGSEDLLPSYDVLGWNPRTVPYDKRFGLPMATQISGFFNALTTELTSDAQAKLRLGSICHRAQDDSDTNPLNAVDLVMRFGYRGGSLLSQAVGTRDSLSGGNSRASLNDVSLKPLYVSQMNGLLDSIASKAMQDLPNGSVPIVGEGIRGLGLSQWRSFSEAQRADKIREIGECLLGKLNILTSSKDVDPRQSAIFQRIYRINPNTAPTDPDAVIAAITYNVLTHVTGPGVITLGNCDYHTGSSTLGDQQDLTMGRHIARAIQAAHELKTPLFFQLITDGGCSADPGTRNWRGDSGEKCMTVVGFYNPNAPQSQPRTQVGYYSNGQGAVRDSVVGSSPMRAAHAAFINYLSVSGRLDDYQRVVGSSQGISPGEIESVLLFNPKV